jgi:hypothetical protein
VVAWGANFWGECDVPPGLSDVIDILASGRSVALKPDGSLIGWGAGEGGLDNNLYSQGPSGPEDIIAIAAGGYHRWESLLLKSDRTVIAFGHQPPSNLRDVVAISVGEEHSLALRKDGTVVSWGYSTPPPDGLTGIIAIAAGAYHDLALKSDGTIVGWGGDPVPSNLSDVVAIDAGDTHSLALRQDGTVVAWGQNDRGQCNVPPGLDSVVAIACGYYHNLALKSDGTVVAWGWNDDFQCEVPAGLDHVIAIAAGFVHSLALKSDGTVTAWGAEQTFGGIPNPNTWVLSQVPADLDTVSAVAAALDGSLALIGTVNQPPVAALYPLATVRNKPASVPLFDLHRICSDPDWDSFIITDIVPDSVAGGQVEKDGNMLVYTPPENFVGQDSFTYTIRDNRGATSQGTVRVNVLDNQDVCDVNHDGCVDRSDLALLMAKIQAHSSDLTYDLNIDGKIDIADARFLVLHFTNPGGSPCPR